MNKDEKIPVNKTKSKMKFSVQQQLATEKED